MNSSAAHSFDQADPDAPHIPAGVDPAELAVTSQRAELARRLLDILALPAGQVNENERAFTGDMLNELLDFVPDVLKIEVAQRLSSVLTPPIALLRRLILEHIDVAGFLLRELKDIPDCLLVEAARVGPAHRDIIVRRLKITDMVAEALLEAEDVPISQMVLARSEVTLAETRIDRLLQMSIDYPSLREPLLHRLELQPRHGFTMFWWVNAVERRKIFSRFAIDRGIIQNSLKQLFIEVFPDPDPDLVVKRVLTLCDRRHRPRGSNGEAVAMDMVIKMLTAARANPTPERCAATGLLAGVSPDTATRVLYDRGGEPFAILCKSIGISRSAFADVMVKSRLMRKDDAAGPAFDEEKAEHLMASFDMIARDYARTVLRYWDWRRETYSSAH
ncbi:DUF2336 domain-containing protein [Parvularcula sp. LCG005]|uniref:DUF2336 domain-containing protein n=1 Tax=Parvularcula sp. LCG005 TaxID=3078805 RepID=UPI0029424BDC|nr:DUF2336 domain-containing protein [Parvularcula sp. LCG005]WOI53959.1 DUF2336 domain-containing protein [Parvularcula sp. LCG005]